MANVQKRNDQPRPCPTTPCRRCLCCVCSALLCRDRRALCYQVHSSVRCHLFLFTPPPMNAPNCLNMTRSRSEASPTASGRAQVQRDHNALVSSGVQNCAKGTHREAPTASIHGHGDASVFGPNDADRRGRACPMGYRFLRVDHNSLKQQPSHGHTTLGSCMTIRIRGLPASFGISKRGDRVPSGREPVPHSGAVRLSTHHPLSTGCRQPQARREPQRRGTKDPVPLPRPGRLAPRGGTNRCVCWAVRTRSFVEEVLLQVERDGEPRGGPQVRRQVIEELL